MNIISDFDYFKFYNENRSKDSGKHKGKYLNKINSLTLFSDGEKVCEKIK